MVYCGICSQRETKQDEGRVCGDDAFGLGLSGFEVSTSMFAAPQTIYPWDRTGFVDFVLALLVGGHGTHLSKIQRIRPGDFHESPTALDEPCL